MYYFDTSFIAPLVIPELNSEAVETFLMKVTAGQLATSSWTKVELASLLARKLRMKEYTAAQVALAREGFETLLTASFTLLIPSERDFSLAEKMLEKPSTGLRSGDALHLAIAANHKVKTLYSLDKVMVKAGGMLKVPCSKGIR
jgi:uncharacterized protein